MKRLALFLLVTTIFIALAVLYTWPVPREIFSGMVLGLGNDETTLPYYYYWIPELFSIAPFSFLNGALFSPQIGAPVGAVLWIPYVERIVPLLFGGLFTPEQMSFVFLISLHVLAGVLMFWLGQRMGLCFFLSLCMGICLSFTPFTYWRGQMHLGLAGVYFLPFLALAYDYMRHVDRWKKIILPSLLLLMALTTAHYMILVFISLVPFVLLYLWYQTQKRKKQLVARLGVQAFDSKRFWKKRILIVFVFLPMMFGLIWIKLGAPFGFGGLRSEAPLFETALPEDPHRSWDVLVFSARVKDYFTGNYDSSAWDLNPLRALITKQIKKEGDFYPQERSSGVRWVLLVLFVAAIIQRKKIPDYLKHWFTFGLLITGVAFLFSLSPRCIAPAGIGICPSRWIHAIIPEMRAPNRWSVAVNFGVIVVVFCYLQLFMAFLVKNVKDVTRYFIGFLFAIVCVLDAPPTFSFPVTDPEPPLERVSGCGLGIILPYWHSDDAKTYKMIASLRYSDCYIINAQQTPFVSKMFYEIFSEKNLLKKPLGASEWKKAANVLSCLDVKWVKLDPNYKEQGASICTALGFRSTNNLYCEDRALLKKEGTPRGNWQECLSGI